MFPLCQTTTCSHLSPYPDPTPPTPKKKQEVSTIKVTGNVLMPLGAGGISCTASAAEGTKAAVIPGKDESLDEVIWLQESDDVSGHYLLGGSSHNLDTWCFGSPP